MQGGAFAPSIPSGVLIQGVAYADVGDEAEKLARDTLNEE